MADEHPLAMFAGTWRGRGDGFYPTIADFPYEEELVITPAPGKPRAAWRTATRNAVTGEGLHAEAGFLRAAPDGLELVVAHGSGVVEIATGTFTNGTLELSSVAMHRAPSAKQVDQITRHYVFDGDVVTYTLDMAAVGVPLTGHLRGELRREI